METWLLKFSFLELVLKLKWTGSVHDLPETHCKINVDLNPTDFYLWGYLKTVVYNPMPKTLEDLMANIKREIESVKKGFWKFGKRCHLEVTTEGIIMDKISHLFYIKFYITWPLLLKEQKN